MKQYILKYTIKLWYRMTFENNKYAKQLFELIEGFYEVTENYISLIIHKSSF
jgi:hypothetical protein|tara:strand:- start:69625 stop:69780 length:156 start_codon:yes stop_codon:yes gene_type:complete